MVANNQYFNRLTYDQRRYKMENYKNKNSAFILSSLATYSPQKETAINSYNKLNTTH